MGATSKEQEPNSVPPKRQLKPTGVVSGGKAYHPKRVAVWSSFSHSEGRQSKRERILQYSSLFLYCRKKDPNSWWIRSWEEPVYRRIFPRRITRIGTKGTRGKSGTGNGVFRVLVLFKLSLVTYPGKDSTKIGATRSAKGAKKGE